MNLKFCALVICCLFIHSVQILLNGDYKVKDGGLIGEYKAVRVDFHWGRDDQNGSEHLINGTRFPMEVKYAQEFHTMTLYLSKFVCCIYL